MNENSASVYDSGPDAHISDLPAFGVGHATDGEHATGCTVIVAPQGAVCGVDVRGGGPATRETDLLKPENMVEQVHAVTLAGGSAFGLEASCGVMEELSERGIGFPIEDARVPIVVGACLFDLLVGKPGETVPAHPDKHMGRAAAQQALAAQQRAQEAQAAARGGSSERAAQESGAQAAAQKAQRTATPKAQAAARTAAKDSALPSDSDNRESGLAAFALAAAASTPRDAGRFGIDEGNVGAGAGASVGKLLGGERAMKSGLGTCFLCSGELVVGAIVSVNALGNVCDSHGRWIAGCLDANGTVLDPLDALEEFTRLPSATVAAADPTASDAPSALETPSDAPCPNTTIGAILTNARITKAQATKTASTAHDAYARAIKPVHTLNDGDTIFCLASCETDALPDIVSILATEAMQCAIVRAVCTAEAACGLPSACDRAERSA